MPAPRVDVDASALMDARFALDRAADSNDRAYPAALIAFVHLLAHNSGQSAVFPMGAVAPLRLTRMLRLTRSCHFQFKAAIAQRELIEQVYKANHGDAQARVHRPKINGGLARFAASIRAHLRLPSKGGGDTSELYLFSFNAYNGSASAGTE
ncbi:hypothetical protein MPC4_110010 [Methylocella tundrae]|uniref:Uncharacterized protein n=2 Tax=Methylocella tundrae TaxID=227605 RepID=A0A8B6M374_METTU|nr:hypothetical protein MPC1_3540005 [Methylocella tundrae]VTZ48710.1 hypothetical protein MPC4_110010 [Methylocella tundrae]